MSDRGSNPARGRKRKRTQYLRGSAKRKSGVLNPGLKGFLITCNNDEKRCIGEAYNILNEYGDKLYGPEQVAPSSKKKVQLNEGDIQNAPEEEKALSSEVEEEDDDIDAALAKETGALKQHKVKVDSDGVATTVATERRFQLIDCGVKNCLFIRTTVSDPETLAHLILSETKKSGKRAGRFIARFLPIAATCRSFMEDIIVAVKSLVQEHFSPTTDFTYAVVYKARHNSSLERMDLINAIGTFITDVSPMSKADLKNPQLAIIVEIVGKITCVAIVKDFYDLKKYNLSEVAGGSSNSEKGKDAVSPDVVKTDEPGAGHGIVEDEKIAVEEPPA